MQRRSLLILYCLMPHITLAAQQIPEIVVEASPLDELSPHDTMRDTTIKRKTMLKNQHRHVTQALQNVPGAILNRTGKEGQRSIVSLRGATSKHTLVLMNGLPIVDPIVSEFDFADLTSDIVENIHIITGSQSLLYGSQAIGGVINIITRCGTPTTKRGATLEGGSHSTVRSHGEISGSQEQIDYFVSSTSFRSGNGSFKNHLRNNRQGDHYKSLTTNIHFGWQPTDNFDVHGQVLYQQGDVKVDDLSQQLPQQADNNSKTQRGLALLTATYITLQGKLENHLSAGLIQTKRDHFKTRIKSNETEGKILQLHYLGHLSASPTHHINFGFTLRQEAINTDTSPHQSETTRGVFLQNQWQILDPLLLDVGVRLDQHPKFGTHVTYRAGAKLNLKRVTLTSSYGTGFRAPSPTEIFGSPPFLIPNTSLNPEKSQSFDIGLEHENKILKTLFEVTFFYLAIEDLIQGVRVKPDTFQNVNIGKRHSRGIESQITTHWHPCLKTILTYTLILAHDKLTGKQPFRLPKHQGVFNMTYAPTTSSTLFLEAIYQSSRQDRDFFKRRNVKLGSYASIRFGGDLSITPHLKIFARIENALNKHYEHIFGFGTRGRSFYTGLSVAL